MKIKGIAKVQLFDENNKIVHEKEEENIITDGINRLLAPKSFMLAKGSGSNYYKNCFGGLLTTDSPYGYLPLYSLFQGVLLFSDFIPENANTILPPDPRKNMAYAGNEYALNNKNRGTYNANESGEIQDGYRHVWDFATDKANGEIKCLCLTTPIGGNLGWTQIDGMREDNTAAVVGWTAGIACSSYTNSSSNNGKIENVYNFYLPGICCYHYNCTNLETENFICIAPGEDAKNNVYLVKTSNSKKLKLTDKNLMQNASINSFNNLNFEVTEIIDLPTNFQTLAERMYFYDGHLHHIETAGGGSSNMTVYHFRYLLDGTFVDLTQFVIDKSLLPVASPYLESGHAFYYEGFYCITAKDAFKQNCIFKFTSAGSKEDEIVFKVYGPEQGDKFYDSSISSYPLWLPEIDAMVFIEEDYIFILYSNFETEVKKGGGLNEQRIKYFYEEDRSVLPFLGASYYSTSSSYYVGRVGYCKFSNFLLSINNITPVTKTTATTMKVTYEIINV